ncbi:UNVERIFIED_CONTAM: Cyclin-B1-4 [Sesamum latifolium]|uniref:Cyclin-B1-4 n=1 Tax=Sesamum latifolium TaxID=2727402 RepID=A0AAW2XZG0_9LAMI
MRAILVNWLIEVHKKFELMPESLYLTVNIVDRFLSVKTVPRRELQLVGISSMLIACKYEEIWAPEVSDFIAISDNAYVREQVLLMEKAILGKLECENNPSHELIPSVVIKCNPQALAAELEDEVQSIDVGEVDFLSSIEDDVYLILESMKFFHKFDIMKMDESLNTFFVKIGAYDEARSLSSEKLSRSLHDQQLKNKERACATLKQKKQLSHDVQVEVHAIEGDIAALENTPPLDDAMVENLESSKANLEVLLRFI